jgi:hypothetical protein
MECYYVYAQNLIEIPMFVGFHEAILEAVSNRDSLS